MNVRIIDPTRKFLQSDRPWKRGSAVDAFADLDGEGAAAAASDDRGDLVPDPMESSEEDLAAECGEEASRPTE